ncbi:carbohydrate ABC transporter permease [uncultured Roseibium sp.]|uniref:carbohydrate ABC transporter permease n=1 Tax=uncultured Roseibium sp. TaxID=1936171 RepID=UPI0026278677|nr:sugar ABC transporter permease [uncultured Roseibium sp.]
MRRAHLLGLGFLSPALAIILMLFLIPVLLTVMFSFTNMSTATGISGGAYEINAASLRKLADAGAQESFVETLGKESFVVDDAGITAAAAAYGEQFANEVGSQMLGERFSSRRDLERAFRKLKSRPRSTRDIKKAADLFKRSVLNIRFETAGGLVDAVTDNGIEMTPDQQELLTKTIYTGWTWTSDNFALMAQIPYVWRVAGNTVLYVVLTLAASVGMGLFLAITTFYLPSSAASSFRAIWFLPRILPNVIFVLMWKWLAWDTGFLSSLLANFGVPPRNWMLDTGVNAWVFIVLINGIVGASLGMILFGSAIKSIPQSMLHASEVDGASRWQQIRYIILPQLRWPIMFICAYSTLSLLTSFEYILLSTDGGPGGATEVWSLMAFHTALDNYAGNLQYGLGAAMALMLVIVGILASLVYLRIFNFNDLVAKPRIEQ